MASSRIVCGRALATWLLAATVLTSWAAPPERGPVWASLTVSQQQGLAPLQRDWSSLDSERKQKWLEVARRLPTLPVDERARIQTRMAEWARMTPAERANARLQFQETRQLSPDERQARWQAYQSLPDEERRQLAQRAKPEAGKGVAAAAPPAARAGGQLADGGNVKRSASTPPSAAAAGTTTDNRVQVKPGATTTTISTRAAPPAHHQQGLPKIAATPGFVDPATLLPQRGPQGAAVRAVSNDPAQQP